MGIIADEFAEKSFAILFLLLLAIPALPLPTGGVTHVFEIIAMLLALELIAGRKYVWLPKRWLSKPLPEGLRNSALPRFIRIIQWVERNSRQRIGTLQRQAVYIRVVGAIVLVFTAFAFLAPPFSGLDTLPSLGVILLSLGLIFEDTLLAAIGFIAGTAGIALILFLSSLVLKLF